MLEKTNDLEQFYSFLANHGFTFGRKTTKIDTPAHVLKEQSGSASGNVSTMESGYQPKDNVELDVSLQYDTYADKYYGQANWHWTSQTLSPPDVIGLTYKENSWSVPQNGYSSSTYASLDTESRSANGYAWKYNDGEDTLEQPNAYNYATLTLNPYDESISDSDRTIWMVYTANSSPYPAYIDGIGIGYGALSVDVSPTVEQDTWIEDNSGDELKISAADAQPI